MDRKSLFRRLGHPPQEVVLESGFMEKGVVEAGGLVKVGKRVGRFCELTASVLQKRNVPDTGRFYPLLAKSFSGKIISVGAAFLFPTLGKTKAAIKSTEVVRMIRVRMIFIHESYLAPLF